MKHHDTITGLVLLGLCALAYWLTTGFSEVPAMLSQNVPPTFFPRLVIGVVAVLSVVLVVTGWRLEPEIAGPLPPAFWTTVAIIAAAGVLTGILGTLLTLGIIAVVLPIAWGERRYRLIAALAICLPACIYLVFTLGLDVRFPAGRVFELLLQS